MRIAYAVAWIIWGAAGVAIESTALITRHDEYTLSDYIWRLERLGDAWTALRYFLAAACVFIFFHIAFGWFR